MKKIIGVLFLVAGSYFNPTQAQIYMGKSCEISFFSETPIENIDATNKVSTPVLNTKTNELVFKVAMTGFIFPKPLMQEHFNEDYVESEKYPYCILKGKINEAVDYTKDGTTPVSVTGVMDLHGVQKEYTVKGSVAVKGTDITLEGKFKIKLVDHKIKVPSVTAMQIAEEVEVKVNTTLQPYVKK